ncbi:MAG: HEAT repeat domain-containing protein [Elusimicrobia bacterium]|nr:HEAT repeat domain-containing protein [Candidatus Obscuribacterium magneticum]
MQTICEISGRATRKVVTGTLKVMRTMRAWTFILGQTVVSATKNVGQAIKKVVPNLRISCCGKEETDEEFATLLKRAKADLHDAEPQNRRVAIRILGLIGSRGVVPYLKQALNDPDPDVRSCAAKTIDELTQSLCGR